MYSSINQSTENLEQSPNLCNNTNGEKLSRRGWRGCGRGIGEHKAVGSTEKTVELDRGTVGERGTQQPAPRGGLAELGPGGAVLSTARPVVGGAKVGAHHLMHHYATVTSEGL